MRKDLSPLLSYGYAKTDKLGQNPSFIVAATLARDLGELPDKNKKDEWNHREDAYFEGRTLAVLAGPETKR